MRVPVNTTATRQDLLTAIPSHCQHEAAAAATVIRRQTTKQPHVPQLLHSWQ